MLLIKRLKGKILDVKKDSFIISKGLDVYHSNFNDFKLKNKISLPTKNKFELLFCKSNLLMRLFRKGVHHYIKTRDDEIFFYNKSVYSVKHGRTISYIGSRPLCICSDKKGNIYYGQYHSNSERNEPSKIFKINAFDFNQEVFAEFDDVRHIHGVFYDKYTDSIWATTGDIGSECGIWRVSWEGSRELFLGGGQQERAVGLQFTAESLIYGTDSPLEENFLYRVNRYSKKREKLAQVSSSVFYSTAVGEKTFFSTAVEPSAINDSKFIEIWEVSDKTEKVLSYKKDLFPMKLFQYGQAQFPLCNGDDKLCLNLISVKNDGYSIIFRV